METARHFVPFAAKLATRVQHRENYFGCAFAFMRTRWVGINRNSAAVVIYATAAIGQQRDADAITKPCHRFVDRVVDDFPNEVVKTSQTSGPDVHAGSFTNGVETFENLNIFRTVIGGWILRRSFFRCCHGSTILPM